MFKTKNESIRSRCAIALAALAFISIGANTDAADPSFTFHDALTGANAGDLDWRQTPVREDVVVFYEHTLGLYPRIDQNSENWINGGIPQEVELTRHLEKARLDIERLIPDPDWDGYAVIDYESWSPWWDLTEPPYRDGTRQVTERRYPGWTDEQIEQQSRHIYELFARAIMEETIRLGKQLRPEAKWGFWSYPRISQTVVDASWLWDLSDAYYPSIYMRDSLVPDGVELSLGEGYASDYIDEMFNGRLNMAKALAHGDKPVLAFAWPRYTQRNENQWLRYRQLKDEDLWLMLYGPYLWGIDGVIIWDNLSQPGVADVFQQYLDQRIAPQLEFINRVVLHNDALDENQIPEDVNQDGFVNTIDLSYVISFYGTDDAAADINDDGIVDTIDLGMVMTAFTN